MVSKATIFSAVLLFAAAWCQSALAVDSAVLQAQQQRIAVIEKVAPAVTAIFGPAGGGGGSGVVISADGYALSNFHVTGSAGDFMKCGLNDGVLYDAVVVGVDPTGDVALLKLLGRENFPFVEMGDSDKLQVGDWAYAVGNPFLLATDFQPTVTFGIVSGVHRYQYPAGTFLEYADCIQVDSSINPGNSGGPLFNSDGELVGINGRGSFEKRGRVNSGAGYAISINQIKHFMGHLRSGRIVDHATLGAAVSSESDGAVTVIEVLEESQVYRRGLRLGDEIVSFAGRPIRSVNQFKNILGIYPKEWKLPLVYRRENQKFEILAQLRALHRESEMAELQARPEGRPPKPDDRKPEGPKKPDDKKPDKKNPDKEQPDPDLPLMLQGPPPPPEKYKHMLVKKDGYANYYFNKLEQDRLIAHLKALGDLSAAQGVWRVLGSTAAGAPVEFMLSDQAVTLEVGKEIYIQQSGEDLKDEPPKSGGLLVAMQHLRQMLGRGTESFDDVYYLGREPLDGHDRMTDVLIAELSSAESRWYFNLEDGTLVGLDLRLQENADECELRILEWGDFNGKRLPSLVSVRSGGVDFATIKFTQIDFKAPNAGNKNPSSPPPPPAPPKQETKR
ncbi:MAG: trypsin-like peptidase domain-containing protein [Planctomycetaceae bacterium]